MDTEFEHDFILDFDFDVAEEAEETEEDLTPREYLDRTFGKTYLP